MERDFQLLIQSDAKKISLEGYRSLYIVFGNIVLSELPDGSKGSPRLAYYWKNYRRGG